MVFLLAQWPAVCNSLLYLFYPSWSATHGNAVYWFSAMGAVNWLMLIAAATAWRFASERLDQIDDIINASDRRVDLLQWLDKHIEPRHQSPLPIASAVLAPCFLWAISAQLDPLVEVNVASYLLVAWTAFLGGNVCYWLWSASGIPRELHRLGQLNLRWHDPVATPGIRLLVDGYSISGMFLAAGVISISLFGFILPRVTNLNALRWLLFAFFALSVAVSVRVSAVTLFWTWKLVVDYKRATLKYLADLVGDKPPEKKISKTTLDCIAVYSALSNTSSLPFATGGLVQYGATILGAIIAFIVGQVTGA